MSETLDTTDNQRSETDSPANTLSDTLPGEGTADIQLIGQATGFEADSGPVEEILVGASPIPLKTFYNVVTDFGANGNDSASDEGTLRQALYEAGESASGLLDELSGL